jgi:hypothetical protein
MATAMLAPEECRRIADLCAGLAEKSADKVERATLSRIASQWRRLANHKAKVQSRRKSSSSMLRSSARTRGKRVIGDVVEIGRRLTDD